MHVLLRAVTITLINLNNQQKAERARTEKAYESTFQSFIVLSFVESRNRAPLAVWHHLILLIFSSISKLFK